MSPILICLICVALLTVLLALGMHIGFVLLFVGFIGYTWITGSPNIGLSVLGLSPYSYSTNYSFVVIPLFILMGNFAFKARISEGLYDVGSKWLNRLPGGLACGTVVACALFGAICGSGSATVATMGTIALPEMRKHHYDDELSCGCIAASGTLGLLIPPSNAFVLYGVASANSIGKMFEAGIMPGILNAAIFIGVTVFLVVRNRKLAPEREKFTWKERLRSLKGIIAVVILFGGVMGGMFSGFFTSNEAAAVGSLLAFLYMIAMHALNSKSLKEALSSTMEAFGMSFVLLMGAAVFANFLSVSRLPYMLSEFVMTLDVSRYVVLAIIIVIYLFLGTIMDAAAILLMTVPVFYPMITSLGFDGIWFGVVAVLACNIGEVSPPVGLCTYIMAATAGDVPLEKVFKGAVPYMIGLLLTLLLIVIFPAIATWLPSLA